jgi:WD40 repeat protein
MRTFKVARSVGAVAFAPDGASLWVGDALGRVHLLDLASGKSREVFRLVPGKPTWPVRNLFPSADGKLVLAASEYPWVLWDVGAARALPLPPDTLGRRALLSADGSMVFEGGTRGWTLWDRAAGAVRHFPKHHPATSAAFSRDGARVAARSYQGPGMTVYAPRTGETIASLSQRYGAPMVFSPDGSCLIAASLPEITVWDTATWREVSTFRVGAAFPTQLAVHPAGRLLAVAVDGPVVALSDLQGHSLGKFDWGVGKVRGLSFSPTGMTAAAGGTRGLVATWDVEDGG